MAHCSNNNRVDSHYETKNINRLQPLLYSRPVWPGKALVIARPLVTLPKQAWQRFFSPRCRKIFQFFIEFLANLLGDLGLQRIAKDQELDRIVNQAVLHIFYDSYYVIVRAKRMCCPRTLGSIHWEAKKTWQAWGFWAFGEVVRFSCLGVGSLTELPLKPETLKHKP